MTASEAIERARALKERSRDRLEDAFPAFLDLSAVAGEALDYLDQFGRCAEGCVCVRHRLRAALAAVTEALGGAQEEKA